MLGLSYFFKDYIGITPTPSENLIKYPIPTPEVPQEPQGSWFWTITGTYLDMQEKTYRKTHGDIYKDTHVDTNMDRIHGEDTDSKNS